MIKAIFLLSALFFVTACDTNGAVQGNGTGNAGSGHVRIGVPFYTT
jgi:hypothetical protein